jgi:hypothetical protein
MLVLIYRRFLAAADRWTATTICLCIVLAFAFNEYLAVGNYNYIAPYSHELFHGLVLSILAIALLADWINKRQMRLALAAGFCFGLVFSTKPDVYLALTAGVVAAFVLCHATGGQRNFAVKSAAAFLAAAMVPALGFFLYFLSVEDWRTSLSFTAFAWVPVFTPLAEDSFYLWCTGLDAPVFHLRVMAIQFFPSHFWWRSVRDCFNARRGWEPSAPHGWSWSFHRWLLPSGSTGSIAGCRCRC